MELLNKDERLSFLSACSARMSSFLKARVLHHTMHGVSDIEASMKNGLAVAVEMGLPAMQGEDGSLLGRF